jgi:hypothetical protein
LVWLNFPTAYSFVMISPNLYAIWVFLLMNLSQDLKCFLLRYFGTLGDGYSLKGSNKKPSRHNGTFMHQIYGIRPDSKGVCKGGWVHNTGTWNKKTDQELKS